MNEIFTSKTNFKMCKIFQVYFLLLITSLIPPSLTLPVIDPSIAEALKTTKVANILISFTKSNTRNLLEQFDGRSLKSREEKLNAFYTQLKTHADEVQATTLNLLKDETSKRQSSDKPAKVHQIWVFNHIIVDNADAELVEKLSKLEEISSIEGEKIISTIPPEVIAHNVKNLAVAKTSKNDEIKWGVKRILAPQVWKQGIKGKGVVVGIMDTGVRGTHEALRGNHRKSFGWFDGYDNFSTPEDGHGHGTHVAGIAVGQTNGIGVAPEAQWIACRSHDSLGRGKFQAVSKCFNWLSCPTLPNAVDPKPDCSNAPHIVNCSWSVGAVDSNVESIFEQLINKWIANGIYPIFTVGNTGPNCGTVRIPGTIQSVVTVGSINENGIVADSSSSGPPAFDPSSIKPNVVAPGVQVISASHASDSEYPAKSGSSQAAPHVSGLAALLKSNFTQITYQEFISFVQDSARPVTLRASQDLKCGGISESEYPNNRAGYGYVDALGALNLAKQSYFTPTEKLPIYSVAVKFKLSVVDFCFKIVTAFSILDYTY